MSSKSFGAAASAPRTKAAPPQEPITVTVQGFLNGEHESREVDLNYPTDSQATVLTMITARRKPGPREVGRFIDLFLSMMSDDDAQFVEDLLMEEDSMFESEHMMGMFEHAMEEWSSRPTGRSNASSTSRPKSGKSSTASARKPVSTRSNSRSGGSST